MNKANDHRAVAARGWRATVHLVTGGPLAVAGLVALAVSAVPALLVVTAPLAVGLVVVLSGRLARTHRERIRAVLGVAIEPSPGEDRRPSFREALTDRDVRRRLGYHLVAAFSLPVAALLVLALWTAALVLAAFAVLELVPGAVPESSDWYALLGPRAAVATLLGALVLLFGASWTARGLATLDVALARALLAPDRAAHLTRRVETLTRSRADVVDAADAERRRIERDLHDGAQQRLVSLAMNLGMIRAVHPDLPDVAEAHEEAKQALAELRDLVRGLHPAVLEDRGLDAALSGIAARSPVPVTLTVDLPERPSPTVEAVAYFIVSEALANVAKHAAASRIDVTVSRAADVLRIEVRDDGTGGADPARGSGLRGLLHRIRAVDGALSVHSPVGGPTIVTAELPCAS